MIHLLVVADVRLYRDGLTDALSKRASIRVVGTAEDEASAALALEHLRPDVALVGLGGDLAGAVTRLHAGAPDVEMVALAVHENKRDVIRLAEAGISGYVTRDGSLDELVTTIEGVVRGEMACSPQVAAGLMRRLATLAAERMPDDGNGRLTARELEIIELIDDGLSNKEIAGRLFIEVSTVKNHVHNALDKLHVHRRGEAAAILRRRLGAGAAAQGRTTRI